MTAALRCDVAIKYKPPIQVASPEVPPYMRTPEEEALIEEGRIDLWLRSIEAGDPPPSLPIVGEWSTVAEVAARHRLSEKTIRKRIYDGSLKAIDQSPPGSPARQRRYRIHREA